VAIDDLQWLDEPTRRVVAYATRRGHGPLAVLTAERADHLPEVDSALCPADATRLRTAQVGPMSVGALHRVLQHEAGRSFSRPTAIRIAERSGGNPFFALQIARSLPNGATSVDVLPKGLKQLVAGQVDALAAPLREALVLASAAADPRVELIGPRLPQTRDPHPRRTRQMHGGGRRGNVGKHPMRRATVRPSHAPQIYHGACYHRTSPTQGW
jgi:hypothetical protein